MSTAERKYVLSKLDAGDYLLPSNDGRIVWRIRRHVETPRWPDEPRGQTVWHVWRAKYPITDGDYIDMLDWDGWDHYDGPFDTRKQAISSALKT